MASTDPFSHIVLGYPKLAAKMEILPEAAIFRRFGALNAQNLLYYQAELTYLEQKLKVQQLKDNNEGAGREKSYGTDWFWLEKSGEEGGARQLELVLRIRELLKEYNQALVHQSTILQYAEPGKWDLHHVQDYLQTPGMGPLALSGLDATIWGSVHDRKSHKPDLVALRPRASEDPFSVWAAENTIFNLFKCGCARLMNPSRVHGVIAYKDNTIYQITYWITNIFASLIPIASIAVLYRVRPMPAKLAIIAAFNILVSVCLMGFANAKRAEVFAVTAAFAAVQVVFVGQGQGLSC